MEQKKEFKAVDDKGNEWRITLEPQEKYNNRFDLKFYFKTKAYKIQQFGTARDADNVWELLEAMYNS